MRTNAPDWYIRILDFLSDNMSESANTQLMGSVFNLSMERERFTVDDWEAVRLLVLTNYASMSGAKAVNPLERKVLKRIRQLLTASLEQGTLINREDWDELGEYADNDILIHALLQAITVEHHKDVSFHTLQLTECFQLRMSFLSKSALHDTIAVATVLSILECVKFVMAQKDKAPRIAWDDKKIGC